MNIEQLEDTLVEKINEDIPSLNLFNFDETKKKRDNSEFCLGRLGISRIKLDDFYLQNTWQLENYPLKPHKLYPNIKFIDFFNLGTYCIKNSISQAKFCRDAILEKVKRDIPKEDIITLKDLQNNA